MFNLLGVQVGIDTQPFSAPVTLRSADTCGVAKWKAVDASHQSLSCAIADVNGDGIPDRVVGTSGFRGTGAPTARRFLPHPPPADAPGDTAPRRGRQRPEGRAPRHERHRAHDLPDGSIA